MYPRLLRKISMALRLGFPSAQDRAYERAIAKAQAFDRSFYLQAHPRLHRLFQWMPERHYVQHGEAAGFSPNGHFSPRAYLFHNADLDPVTTRPLLHYLQTGHDEARTTWLNPEDIILPGFPADPLPVQTPALVAVVVHLYYLDMWDEFADLLASQTFEFNLWVTLTDDGTKGNAQVTRAKIKSHFPQAQVHILPNHGRDIFPFIWLLRSGVLAPYAAVCKLHSKKSPHRTDGDEWRHSLIDGILGGANVTARRLTTFINTTDAGFWVAEGQHYKGDIYWGVNRKRACEILARRGLDLPDTPLSFPAGSIYWICQTVLTRIAALDLTVADFEPEQALVDGTTAHALERILGCLATQAGLTIVTSSQLDSLETQTTEPR